MASGATSSQPTISGENANQPQKEELFNSFYTEVRIFLHLPRYSPSSTDLRCVRMALINSSTPLT